MIVQNFNWTNVTSTAIHAAWNQIRFSWDDGKLLIIDIFIHTWSYKQIHQDCHLNTNDSISWRQSCRAITFPKKSAIFQTKYHRPLYSDDGLEPSFSCTIISSWSSIDEKGNRRVIPWSWVVTVWQQNSVQFRKKYLYIDVIIQINYLCVCESYTGKRQHKKTDANTLSCIQKIFAKKLKSHKNLFTCKYTKNAVHKTPPKKKTHAPAHTHWHTHTNTGLLFCENCCWHKQKQHTE